METAHVAAAAVVAETVVDRPLAVAGDGQVSLHTAPGLILPHQADVPSLDAQTDPY